MRVRIGVRSTGGDGSKILLRRLQVAASVASASPAGAGLAMSLDSGRVVVGAGGVGEEGAGHLLALSFDAVAGTDLGGQTCGCVSAEVDRRAAGDRVAQMSVQPVECSAPFAGQFVATIRQQPEHAPVLICADSREIRSPGGDHRDRAGCHGRCPHISTQTQNRKWTMPSWDEHRRNRYWDWVELS